MPPATLCSAAHLAFAARASQGLLRAFGRGPFAGQTLISGGFQQWLAGPERQVEFGIGGFCYCPASLLADTDHLTGGTIVAFTLPADCLVPSVMSKMTRSDQ